MVYEALNPTFEIVLKSIQLFVHVLGTHVNLVFHLIFSAVAELVHFIIVGVGRNV